MAKRKSHVPDHLGFQHQDHATLGIEAWERLAGVFLCDRVHADEVVVGTPVVFENHVYTIAGSLKCAPVETGQTCWSGGSGLPTS